MEFRLRASEWRSLDAEAARQGVSLAELVRHAAMMYVADLDAGRVAAFSDAHPALVAIHGGESVESVG